MTKESRRQSLKDYTARRMLTGERKVTVWLGPAARAKLADDATKLGLSKDATAELAILKAEVR